MNPEKSWVKIARLLDHEKAPTFRQCIYFSMVFHGWLPDFDKGAWVATCNRGLSLACKSETIDSLTLYNRDRAGRLGHSLKDLAPGLSVWDLAKKAWDLICEERKNDEQKRR